MFANWNSLPKVILALFTLVTIQLSFCSIGNAYSDSSRYRLSDKGAWTLLNESGFHMNKINLIHGYDFYDEQLNETLQLYFIRFSDKTEVQFQCNSDGYPITCGVQYPKDNLMGMMTTIHLLVYHFNDVYMSTGQYLNQQVYRAVTQGINTDYPLPDANVIYYFRGDMNVPDMDVYRIVINRNPRW